MKGGLAAAGPKISQEPSLGAIHFAFATRALVETLIRLCRCGPLESLRLGIFR